jgi:hypothetical protein
MTETIYHAVGGAKTFHRLCNDFIGVFLLIRC